MKKIMALSLFFLTVLSMVSCQKVQDLPDAVSFTNPLLPIGPDPWVIQKDSFYYYTSTLSNVLAITKTKSLSRLKNAESKVIWKPAANTPNTYNIWAPELHFFDHKWYMYYTAGASLTDFSRQRIFVLENSSEDPLTGIWINKGKVSDAASDYFSIDATVLDIDTARYLLWSSVAFPNSDRQCIYIEKLENPWTLTGGRVMISAPEYGWEKEGLPVTSGVNEGPEIIKNSAGQVFLVYSASGCWTDSYGLGMMMLKKGSDPLQKDNWIKYEKPVMSTWALSNAYGPGHNTFFKSPDGSEDWIMYHANPGPDEKCLGQRSPRMQKFTWNADGTPNFGQPVPINKKIKRPSGEKD